MMDVEFIQNQIKPSDSSFVYDVRKDFEAPSESNDWDSEPELKEMDPSEKSLASSIDSIHEQSNERKSAISNSSLALSSSESMGDKNDDKHDIEKTPSQANFGNRGLAPLEAPIKITALPPLTSLPPLKKEVEKLNQVPALPTTSLFSNSLAPPISIKNLQIDDDFQDDEIDFDDDVDAVLDMLDNDKSDKPIKPIKNGFVGDLEDDVSDNKRHSVHRAPILVPLKGGSEPITRSNHDEVTQEGGSTDEEDIIEEDFDFDGYSNDEGGTEDENDKF